MDCCGSLLRLLSVDFKQVNVDTQATSVQKSNITKASLTVDTDAYPASDTQFPMSKKIMLTSYEEIQNFGSIQVEFVLSGTGDNVN